MEAEPITMDCPYCSVELSIPSDLSRYTCEHCGRRLDMLAQYAFMRGRELYLEAVEVAANISTPPKLRSRHDPNETKMIRSYQQAYSEIRRALESDLADGQRRECVEMMVEMTRIFSQRWMTSSLEVGYWAKLLTEYNSLDELDTLRAKLATSTGGGLIGALRRWRWRNRSLQIERGLRQLDEQIRDMETQIAFVNPLHVRKARAK